MEPVTFVKYVNENFPADGRLERIIIQDTHKTEKYKGWVIDWQTEEIKVFADDWTFLGTKDKKSHAAMLILRFYGV